MSSVSGSVLKSRMGLEHRLDGMSKKRESSEGSEISEFFQVLPMMGFTHHERLGISSISFIFFLAVLGLLLHAGFL